MSAQLLLGRLFYGLRRAGLKVGLTEWVGLMEALEAGAIPPKLSDFYQVARALLVKSETHFDTWDQVFCAVFGDGELPTAAAEELLDWLEDPIPMRDLSPEEIAALEALPLEKLRELFEERMREQNERHDGGSRWIGTGGTSPFGHGGRNPAGVRVGGKGRSASAVQVASRRRFRDYRDDRVIDTRAFAVALKKLRRLSREEARPELDVEESIDATCRNAGDLELVFRPPRTNQARVLLLMDTGGSMDPHARMVEALFSAASSLGHWRRFEALAFHNCVYERLWERIWTREGVPTAEVLADRPPETFLIVVGDATMAPSELTARHGALDWYHRNETPGVVWLHRLRRRFPRAIWLNPLPGRWWNAWTCRVVGTLFPMLPLTLAGLEEGMDVLLKRRPEPVQDLPDWLTG